MKADYFYHKYHKRGIFSFTGAMPATITTPCLMEILSYLCPVKKFLKKAALINLILLYGFVISFYSAAGSIQYSQVSGQQTEQQSESCQSLVSKDLLSHTSSTENVVKLVSQATASSLKNQFTGFVEYIGATNQLILARFQQYSFFSKNLLLRISQYDIIYPSHFFW